MSGGLKSGGLMSGGLMSGGLKVLRQFIPTPTRLLWVAF